MAEIIRDGGSVTHGGVLYREISELPSDAELSLGDSQKEKEAKADILAEMQKLQAELEVLKSKEAEDKPKAGRKAADDKTPASTTE